MSSTLSIARQRFPHHDDVDASFAALAQQARRTAALPSEASVAGFDEVFDLDYGQTQLETRPAECEPAPEAAVLAPPRSRRRVRLTRRGRVTLTLLFLGVVMALMVPLSGLATATLTGGDPEPVRVVEVGPGDTLYGIAADLAGPGEIRAMVHRIQELNSLPGGQIQEGQKLAVPAS